MEKTTVRIDARLLPAVEQMEALMDRVRQMPVGGDLEGLIEEGLAGITEAFYEQTLVQRQHSLGERAEDFSPGGMPQVRGANADASGPATQGAPSADVARTGSICAHRMGMSVLSRLARDVWMKSWDWDRIRR